MEDTKQIKMTNMQRYMLAKKLNMLDDIYEIARNTPEIFDSVKQILINTLGSVEDIDHLDDSDVDVLIHAGLHITY